MAPTSVVSENLSLAWVCTYCHVQVWACKNSAVNISTWMVLKVSNIHASFPSIRPTLLGILCLGTSHPITYLWRDTDLSLSFIPSAEEVPLPLDSASLISLKSTSSSLPSMCFFSCSLNQGMFLIFTFTQQFFLILECFASAPWLLFGVLDLETQLF